MNVQIYKSEICKCIEIIEMCYSRDLGMDPKVIIKWWQLINHVLTKDITAITTWSGVASYAASKCLTSW